MAIPQGNDVAAITGGSFTSAKATVKLTPALVKMLSSNIYEYPKAAIVRELLSNCRDVMKLVGTIDTHEIEVTLPNAFKPNLRFRDYGTGLTQDQAMEMYLSFGDSSKQDSNVEVGMFGIGSKSPLSYTDSFLVESYQGGIKTTYNIFTNSGIPEIAKISEQPTTEEDGLAVNIAIKHEDHIQFKSDVKHFLKFFDAKVKVMGDPAFEVIKPIFSLEKDNYKVCDNFGTGVYAVMGGVTYRLSDAVQEQLKKVVKANCIILPFEVGALSPAPSRENLTMDDHTKKNIDDRIQEITDTYLADLKSAVASQTTLHELMKSLKGYGIERTSYWGNSTNMDHLEWNGRTIHDWRADVIDNDAYLPCSTYRVFHRNGKDHLRDKISTLIGFSGMYYTGNADGIVTVVVNDRKTGSIKFCRELASTNNRVILVDSQKDADDLKDSLKEIFTKVNIHSVEKEYETLFPKGSASTKTRVKVSGAFLLDTTTRFKKEVTEIELKEGEKTYYLPLVRDKVDPSTSGMETNPLDYKWLIDDGYLDKIYFVRKTASKKLLKGLTDLSAAGAIGSLLKGSVSENEVKLVAKCDVYLCKGNDGLETHKLKNAGYECISPELKAACSTITNRLVYYKVSQDTYTKISKALAFLPDMLNIYKATHHTLKSALDAKIEDSLVVMQAMYDLTRYSYMYNTEVNQCLKDTLDEKVDKKLFKKL